MYILKWNCYAEIMEKLGVEVDIKIQYLVEKGGKNYIFKLDFYTLFKTPGFFFYF